MDVDNAVLYTTWGKRFIKYHGKIRGNRFYFDDPISGAVRHFCVYSKPGTMYNKMIWFEQENDEAARKRLMLYEENCISDLSHKLSSHKYFLKMLTETNEAEDFASYMRNVFNVESENAEDGNN